MSEDKNDVFTTTVKNMEESVKLTKRLLEVTKPEVVFSKPVKAGEYTVITASEAVVNLGSGYGYGGANLFKNVTEEDEGEYDTKNGGGGGGGGGMASARPVAVISIGPDGVRVTPVLDRTKFGIALVTTVGSMFMALSRMKKR